MPRTTTAGLAEEQLRKMVLGGQLASGERLNEVQIAQRLGISRGPLREAIQRLASEGLLSVVPHKGAYVRTQTEDQVRQLYELRIAIEVHAVRLGTVRGTPEQFEQLTRTLRETRVVLDTGEQEPYPSDLDVHAQMVGLAQNAALYRAMREAHTGIHLARARSAYDPDRARVAYKEHEKIVQLIIDGKGEEAARLLEEHLLSSLANALKRMGKAT